MNERIEPYFKQELSPPEREQFERELRHNPELADEVAFYLRTKEVLREQILAERHAEWQQMDYPSTARPLAPVHRLSPRYYVAAAVVLLVIAWVWVGIPSSNIRELADGYVKNNLNTLPVQMGGEGDSLQTAIQRYNDGQLDAAHRIGETLLQRNPDNAEALELLGIISLRQQDYDEAITYFHRLAQRQDLHTNPGTFYEALAYLQRGHSSDPDTARQLLQAVVSKNLEGKPEAEAWLEKMDE